MRDTLLRRGRWAVGLLLCGLAALGAGCAASPWSAGELSVLRSLSLQELGAPPPDPSNRVADEPRAAQLGERLFFDARLSANGEVSCATCHQPARYYTDGRARAQGLAPFTLNSMTLLGSAWSPWQTWNGKADSQWMQALLPLENAAEHGLDRAAAAQLLAGDYAAEYEEIFGPLPPLHDGARFPPHAAPAGASSQSEFNLAWQRMAETDRVAVNEVFANLGKALAAFERTLAPAPAPFDDYVAAAQSNDGAAMRALLGEDEVAGLRLFIGKAQCINCHNGPLLTNFEFHNTAVPPVPGQPIQRGRSDALAALTQSEFNCLGPHSDAQPEECTQLRFLLTEGATLTGAFRTPTLRNVAETAPYMHAGQFATLAEVIDHYNGGGLQMLGHNELSPLGLTEKERLQLEAFLRTLTGERPRSP